MSFSLSPVLPNSSCSAALWRSICGCCWWLASVAGRVAPLTRSCGDVQVNSKLLTQGRNVIRFEMPWDIICSGEKCGECIHKVDPEED